MLFAYPYDRAEISAGLFCALTLLSAIFTVRFPEGALPGRHILAVCVILNAVLCLTVTVLHAANVAWFYNVSFFALFALFVSF